MDKGHTQWTVGPSRAAICLCQSSAHSIAVGQVHPPVFPPITKPIRMSLLLVIPTHGSTCAQVFSPPVFLLLTLPLPYSLVIQRPIHCQSHLSVPVSPLSQQCHCALALPVLSYGTLQVGTGSSSITWKLVKNAVSVSTPHLLTQRLG